MVKKSDEELYRIKASILQALAHPIRLKIIGGLSKEQKCVSDIAKEVGAERSNVSRHISILLKAELLTSSKKGLNIFYKLKMPCVLKFLFCAEEVIKKQHELRSAILAKKGN